MSKMRFLKRRSQFLFLSFLCCCKRNRKKTKLKGQKNLCVIIQKWEKWKKWILNKNCLTLFVSGREKNAHFRAHYLFWRKFSWDQNSENQKKTIKIVVSAEIAQNQKWHLFLKKVFFDMGEKVGFTDCVFEKLCSSENTSFIVFSAKHSNCTKKAVCWKKQKIYEKSWVVFDHGKKVQALMLLWFVFVCLVRLHKP